MALWQDIPGKDTKINRKNLSRLEKFTQATCEVDSDFIVNFDGASGLDNYDIVKIAFINAIDEDKQARLSIDNGTTFYDIKDQLGKDVQGKEIELIFKMNQWEIKSLNIKKELEDGEISIGDEYDEELGGELQVWGDMYHNGLPVLTYEIVDTWE